MAKIVAFPITTPDKLGPKRARKRRPDLEELGQLNLFERQAILMSRSSEESFFESAMRHDDSGDFEEAKRLYALAIERGESKADALCNLGILASQADLHSQAIDYLTKALAEEPRHFEAHYNLANVYSDIGNSELSKIHYEMAIQIMPEFPNTYYNLGLVLISLKKFPQAAAVIDQYIALSPDRDDRIAEELIKTLKAFA